MSDLPEFLLPLATFARPFPRAAVEDAAARRAESVPHLLAALERAATEGEGIGADAMLHAYAVYLLAQFWEPRALGPLVRLARRPEVDFLLGDTITEGLGRALASVAGGETKPIRELVEDPEADEYARGAGLVALGAMFRAGSLPRERLSDYLAELFGMRLERDPGHVWNQLIGVCTDLGFDEHRKSIRLAFEEGYADPSYEDWESVEERLRLKQVATYSLEAFDLIDDCVAEMSGWYCFTEAAARDAERAEHEAEAAERAVNEADFAVPPSRDYGPAEPYVRPAPKVGRNEPCPCGSGKKFKKCCGA